MSTGREAQRAAVSFEAGQLVIELETLEEVWNERLRAHCRKAAVLGVSSLFDGLTVAQFFAKRDSSPGNAEQNEVRRQMRRSNASAHFWRPLPPDSSNPGKQ